jgi:hypothetical protein
VAMRFTVYSPQMKDLRQITLSWPIVYANDEEKETFLLAKPYFYIAYVIGHEGPGSGLGLLEIARRSSEPIRYIFDEIDEHSVDFIIAATI